MNPKMKSAIEKITLNDATFSNEVIEPTYVNFFYGKNGAGKSTIARTFKANDERLQWQAGKASTDYDVLVYDTDFINANLRNYGNLAGVFTVNETNIAIQEQVDTLNAERKKMGEESMLQLLITTAHPKQQSSFLPRCRTRCIMQFTDIRQQS